ncbi:MAG: MFS transporter, partial [Victivallales bacterium]|nr:MFS transporter [Victivallales bacterium]
PALIVSGCLIMAIASLLLIVFKDASIQLYWALLAGLGSALFFCSFQIFMKAAEKDVHAGIARSTALYGFAWSCGIASGPFIASFVWGQWKPDSGWVYCYWICIIFMLCVAAATWPLKHYIDNYHRRTVSGISPTVNYSQFPDLAWLGWLTAGIGCLAISLIRTVFPYKAKLLHIGKEELGYIMALVAYSQGFFSLLLVRGKRYWMYKILPIIMFSLCGFTGMFLFWCGTGSMAFYAGAVIYGIYSSGAYFYMVFHSLVHPEKSGKYISMNEVIVGFTGIAAPLLGGFMVDASGNENLPFIAAAAVIAAAIIIQVVTLRKIDPVLFRINSVTRDKS